MRIPYQLNNHMILVIYPCYLTKKNYADDSPWPYSPDQDDLVKNGRESYPVPSLNSLAKAGQFHNE